MTLESINKKIHFIKLNGDIFEYIHNSSNEQYIGDIKDFLLQIKDNILNEPKPKYYKLSELGNTKIIDDSEKISDYYNKTIQIIYHTYNKTFIRCIDN